MSVGPSGSRRPAPARNAALPCPGGGVQAWVGARVVTAGGPLQGGWACSLRARCKVRSALPLCCGVLQCQAYTAWLPGRRQVPDYSSLPCCVLRSSSVGQATFGWRQAHPFNVLLGCRCGHLAGQVLANSSNPANPITFNNLLLVAQSSLLHLPSCTAMTPPSVLRSAPVSQPQTAVSAPTQSATIDSPTPCHGS